MMQSKRFILVVFLSLLFAVPPRLSAQQEEESAASWRIGVQAAVQTNLLRYTVFPYRGEFQTVTSENVIPGVVLQYRFSESFCLQGEVDWWSQEWNVSHDGDPRVLVERMDRSMVEIPVLLQYRVPFASIPVYLAAGPVLMLGTDEKLSTQVQYRSFTERGGWQVSTQEFEEHRTRIGGVAEIGLDVPLSQVVALQPALRFYQPFTELVDEELLTVRDFSYWRASLAVFVSF